MSEVKSIDMKAMSMITINLKGLRESGISTSVAGLNGATLNLAKELGMQFMGRQISRNRKMLTRVFR